MINYIYERALPKLKLIFSENLTADKRGIFALIFLKK